LKKYFTETVTVLQEHPWQIPADFTVSLKNMLDNGSFKTLFNLS